MSSSSPKSPLLCPTSPSELSPFTSSPSAISLLSLSTQESQSNPAPCGRLSSQRSTTSRRSSPRRPSIQIPRTPGSPHLSPTSLHGSLSVLNLSNATSVAIRERCTEKEREMENHHRTDKRNASK